MQLSLENNALMITDIECFDLARSCECGQAFRWHRWENGYLGVVSGRTAFLKQNENILTITPCTEDEVPFWIRYLDLERDYKKIEWELRAHPKLCSCISESYGIHVFRQEPFETLISFIVSANNNVKRIMGTMEKLSILAGEPFETQFGVQYAFPTPEALAACNEEELRACGTGYRAPYIRNTAAAVRDGFALESLRELPLQEARKKITVLPGVGPKVADCILLYSLGHDAAFPMDVWMKRIMRVLFFDGQEPPKKEMNDAIEKLGPQAGIIQQYLFHFARTMQIEA